MTIIGINIYRIILVSDKILKCNNCKRDNSAVAKFCGGCGSVLVGPTDRARVLSKKYEYVFSGSFIILLMIVVSVIYTFPAEKIQTYNSQLFTDIALEHPVYKLLSNMIEAGAWPAPFGK